MEPEQLEIELLQGQTPRRRVETWRGKPINAMTREEAIQALTECTTAYRDHLNNGKEAWERHQKWGHTPRAPANRPNGLTL